MPRRLHAHLLRCRWLRSHWRPLLLLERAQEQERLLLRVVCLHGRRRRGCLPRPWSVAPTALLCLLNEGLQELLLLRGLHGCGR